MGIANLLRQLEVEGRVGVGGVAGGRGRRGGRVDLKLLRLVFP